jgi:hypothetical protein
MHHPTARFSDERALEKYSSAFTLSDMEVFLFPELLHALVLANTLSPRIWRWRSDPWFAKIKTMPLARRLQRLKQYIIDHYAFNLDLDTWGLTTKERELGRFRSFMDTDMLSRSNALFGYEGDKYYFDIDIRRHFGLDKYDGDVLPYWKTETVEAMDAFAHKPGYATGAGECVSLSALYAAALFIVAEVPLEDIFMMATPLHSQNFIARESGTITNNRRLVTKKMWFNGTALSEKARRALDKERVTIVSHISGYTHIEYPDATIDPSQFTRFRHELGAFLTADVTFALFTNFLRVHSQYQKHFSFECRRGGHLYYVAAERLYAYEHSSRRRVDDASMRSLADEVENDDLEPTADPSRHVLGILERALDGQSLRCCSEASFVELRRHLAGIPCLDDLSRDLRRFACTTPRLPSADKRAIASEPLALSVGWSREQIARYLADRRGTSVVADLAFYANRHVQGEAWTPFLKACWERNPVSVQAFRGLSVDQVYEKLKGMPTESIYEGDGLATPDEVVNFGRADGAEKALCLANIVRNGPLPGTFSLRIEPRRDGGRVEVGASGKTYRFETGKDVALERPQGAQ